MIREALLYEKLADCRVQCALCAHRCKINPDRRGLCGVRENRGGILYSLVFGTLIALMHRERPVIGVIDHPAGGNRWVGVEGRPTLRNGTPCRAQNARAWASKSSPAACRPWCTWNARARSGQRSRTASNQAVESAPPL